MLQTILQGSELALRSGATSVLLGVRWAEQLARALPRGIPSSTPSLSVMSKVMLDEFFFATELLSAPFVSPSQRRRTTEELKQAVDIFGSKGWLDNPTSYHIDPPPLRLRQRSSHRSAFLDYDHIQYHSGYEPHAGEPGRERWMSYRSNDFAHAWIAEHEDPSRPWLVCVPGYRMGYPAVDFTGFRAKWLHQELGLNIAIPVLPFHGPRRHGRRGGDGFLTGDFIDTVHAQTQAVWDIRRLIGWLRFRGAESVGVYGVSLGGYTASLIASLEDGLDCAVLGIPAADFVRLVRSHVPSVLLRFAEANGYSLDDADEVLTVVSPFAHQPRVPHHRRYIYAGIADRLAYPEHARNLWRHWGKPEVAWYEGGHVSFLWETAVRKLLLRCFQESGWLLEATSKSA